jgi:general secretion pathway protein K
MIGLLKNNRGMALLLTVMIISIIVVVTLQFNTAMRSDLQAAANLRDGVKLGYIARSGFNLARSILLVDAQESDYDSLNETWAKTSMLSGYSSVILQQGGFELSIVDHSGRIQINGLVYAEDDAIKQQQRELWRRFLLSEEFGLDEEEVDAIISALIDWLDEDNEETGFGGAESFYYQTLDVPYVSRNGPMEFVEDLLNVKGITRELYYGDSEHPGIRQFVTPFGNDGKININTAPPLVLRALADPIDAVLAEEMVAYRDSGDGDLSNVVWYQDVPGFPGDVDIPASSISVASSYFEVRASAFLGTMNRTVTGVIRKNRDSTEVISYAID